MSALHCDSQFVLQRGGGRLATAGQGPDHQELTGLQLGQEIPAGMTELTGHPVPLDGVADLTRVLRVPGTVNLKIAGRPRPVPIATVSGARWAAAMIGTAGPIAAMW